MRRADNKEPRENEEEETLVFANRAERERERERSGKSALQSVVRFLQPRKTLGCWRERKNKIK